MKILHTTPAQDGFYMPAEFAPHELPDDLAGTRRQLAVRRLCGPESFLRVIETISESESMTVLCSEGQYDNARAQLPDRVRLVVMETDDAWARDVGPTFVINGRGERRGIDWGFNAWGGGCGRLYPSWEKDNRVAPQVLRPAEQRRIRQTRFICEAAPSTRTARHRARHRSLPVERGTQIPISQKLKLSRFCAIIWAFPR